MGQILLDFYKTAREVGGVKAAGRLSMITKVSSFKAASEPDSPENIDKFEKALLEIRKEYL
jgi:hypothetical protein